MTNYGIFIFVPLLRESSSVSENGSIRREIFFLSSLTGKLIKTIWLVYRVSIKKCTPVKSSMKMASNVSNSSSNILEMEYRAVGAVSSKRANSAWKFLKNSRSYDSTLNFIFFNSLLCARWRGRESCGGVQQCLQISTFVAKLWIVWIHDILDRQPKWQVISHLHRS